MSDEGYREIHLTGKELVFLFMAATVVAVVIFLLGVLVGRGVQAERDTGSGSTLVSAPQIVPDAAAQAAMDSPAPTGQTGAGPIAAPPAVDEAGTPNPGASTSAFSARAQSAGLSGRRPSAPPDPGATPAGRLGGKSAKEAAAPAEASGEGSTGGYSVQVAATTQRAEADGIVRRLATKGYRAFVYAPKGKAPAGVFRVRVGPFPSLKDAEEASRKLEKEEQYKPWIIR